MLEDLHLLANRPSWTTWHGWSPDCPPPPGRREHPQRPAVATPEAPPGRPAPRPPRHRPCLRPRGQHGGSSSPCRNATSRDHEVATLVERTDGWVVGLQLAAISLQQVPDVGRAIESFAGSDRIVAEYLMEEVIERQRPQVRRFLLATSILEWLSVDLCDAVTGTGDAGTMLDDVAEALPLPDPAGPVGRALPLPPPVRRAAAVSAAARGPLPPRARLTPGRPTGSRGTGAPRSRSRTCWPRGNTGRRST